MVQNKGLSFILWSGFLSVHWSLISFRFVSVWWHFDRVGPEILGGPNDKKIFTGTLRIEIRKNDRLVRRGPRTDSRFLNERVPFEIQLKFYDEGFDVLLPSTELKTEPVVTLFYFIWYQIRLSQALAVE